MYEVVTLHSINSFYFIHISISAIISVAAAHYLSRRYKDNNISIFLLFLFFNIVIPILGYLLTIWICYYLLVVKYVKTLKNTKMLNMQELDHEFPRVKRTFGEGSIVELMSSSTASKKMQMKALSIMAQDMTKKNISLIKLSLSDKDDEVRLYSFSLIDTMEQNINTNIHEASLRFSKALSSHDKAIVAKELAYLYWDMVYFELSDDVLKSFLINESLKYAKIVFQENMLDVAINILLGKIYLAKNDTEQASTQFIMAIENGIEYEYILPYIAEIYFDRKNYTSIKSMFKLSEYLELNAVLYPVIAQWKDNG